MYALVRLNHLYKLEYTYMGCIIPQAELYMNINVRARILMYEHEPN